jgi:hypothetical protein
MDSVAVKRRRVRRKVPSRDIARGILAALLLMIVIGAGLYEREWLLGPRQTLSSIGDSPDHALRTGSIVFVPPSGNNCRHRLIDNVTWFIRDNGYVECNELASRGSNSVNLEYNSSPRLDAIRDAFSRKR